MRQIRESKFSKIIAYYLMIMMALQVTQPMQMYALTEGPSQPEFNSFTPIGTSDMVDLSSGDFNYNIPIMDVGGYPINLAYNSGVTMDQEASWTGLGWNLNVGQINRQMRGLPDDFNGDPMVYETAMKDNVTVGGSASLHVGVFGVAEGGEMPKGNVSLGLGVKYNNYDGIGVSVTGGFTYAMNDNVKVGMQMESSVSEGVSASPTISYDAKFKAGTDKQVNLGGDVGVSYNSRKGIENMTFSSDLSRKFKDKAGKDADANGGLSGNISFVNNSFTPTKRNEMRSSSFLFNMNVEGAVYGIDPGSKFSGYVNVQGLSDSEKYKVERGYGYENTKYASHNDILDFNREKDRTVNKNTTTLPQTNYTYDIYSIQGQGVSGTFRPYKGQVGYVYDNTKNDQSNAGSLGIELGMGAGHHWGFNANFTRTNSSSSVWAGNNNALNRFTPVSYNNPSYEDTYFKTIGGNHVDTDYSTFTNAGGYQPVKFGIGGSSFGRSASVNYQNNSGAILSSTEKIYRKNRVKRNQSIQKLTRKEAAKFGFKTQISQYAKDHHTAEIRVINEGGERYVFGRALYNVTKKEATFDVSGRNGSNITGMVNYLEGDNSANNNRNGDRYFNRVTTPAYAHTYLLTNVLSSDYQDISNDGPSDDDLGNYTKFTYTNKNQGLYKWRIPYKKYVANYDEGLKSDPHDNKASYTYGEKELSYIEKIETKTHIAIFTLSARKDGFGVEGENGGFNSALPMYKLDKISLYSKPEYLAKGVDAKPIKEAHFIYDYSLCKGVENNSKLTNIVGNEIENQGGKLTLKKVYFTYRDSNMGKFTPYTFDYQNNNDYDAKAYDAWGNYKPSNANGAGLSNTEYPYVSQADRLLADKYATAWQLNSIKLPSGGEIKLKHEADDYAYVQNKEAMQMFKVVGMSHDAPTSINDSMTGENRFYHNDGLNQNYYMYLQLDKPVASSDEFIKKYIKDLMSKEIYFRFLVNMSDPSPLPGASTDPQYDYVTGYLNIENVVQFSGSTSRVAIKVRSVKKGDGLSMDTPINPVTKAGLLFGRSYLSKLVFGLSNSTDTNNLRSAVFEILGAIPSALQIFKSPNSRLLAKGIADRFIPQNSWIRLMSPDGKKIGGGSRVKEIRLVDEWDVMTESTDNPLYEQSYGQEYSYETTDLKTNAAISSGVATYEPLGSKENPFIMPFYDKEQKSGILGPKDQNYVEMPFGESFFPSPKVTYSKVTVKNLARQKTIGVDNYVVKKHATGTAVTEFFTSKDYPTLVDYTPLSSRFDKSPLGSIIKINAKEHLTMSQGFVIHTNDMDGKMRNQNVYAENNTLISGAKYIYSNNQNPDNNIGLLNNEVTTIDSKGNVKKSIVGVDYDVINDFREHRTKSITPGLKFNTAGLPLALIYLIVPTPLPTFNQVESKLKCATTTKVIHSSGILRETIAYQDNAEVSTKNLAWDAETGQVLLTQTVNEYKDNYFSFNYPAYWSYTGMGQASTNLDLTCKINILPSTTNYVFSSGENASKYLIPGDELWVIPSDYERLNNRIVSPYRAWVTTVASNGAIQMIGQDGMLIDKFKIKDGTIKVIRSGHRNMQSASMASVTSMKSPLVEGDATLRTDLFNSNDWSSYKIINASAVEYNDLWPSQCECNLPKMRLDGAFEYNVPLGEDEDIDDKQERSFNPYLYNVLGNWRPKKSHAYLTGRHHGDNPNPRNAGFFENFRPYYVFNTTQSKWIKNTAYLDKWTFASEISQYNPYGQEVENRDALNRYSSAHYGFNYKFPLAVASNTQYKELAYDGFEDYAGNVCDKSAHFNFNGKDGLKENEVIISDKQSHTGRYSIRVSPGKKATITKKVVTCAPQNGTSRTIKKAIRTKK
ncbi:hypothetical protein [Flavobacterium humi]|uniref:PA14 domain-containing protein n=1 Tax=Flavobacterium humi TaxID=2562683 RepID=A0A4Z0L3E0_9FLAO|nr:hypothetical protein [Flavobacterium humi]TGD56851.1 hypothetical protein E4635_13710 [Flavobacterium humi]